ncbi:EAL domain-containing protein [Nocardioides mangrovicus]|uniref:EAL domain-containing protein n=1 Tax=Nocardioides mangrovicus TaxID=2478913 RepID=UPI0018E0B324|nr:EAL domain-containing protein [Nocardioides mangrovicus]
MPSKPDIAAVVDSRSVHTVFQPVVDLDDGAVVAYEALSRGPAGPLERPDVLFAAAAEHGLLASLDQLCRSTAVRQAASMDWPEGVALFVNVEPAVLEAEPLDELIALARFAPRELRVVLEITERAISARPAELLASVRRLRQAGWRIALDDVGADDMSLAFMPLLQPDIIKLDLSLVQRRPGPAIARIMNAVNAYAQRTGAIILAEGIENEEHLHIARALGARLGQGWLFGRPAADLHPGLPAAPITWGSRPNTAPAESPFACLPDGTQLRRSTKPLLVEISKHLEQEALQRGSTCVVVATFQHARQFTPSTAQRYSALAERLGFVAAIGQDLPHEPAPGVRGADMRADDALAEEWDVVVLAPHFAAALLARDLGDSGDESERRFEFALSYDREIVSSAAEALLSRVSPVEPRSEHDSLSSSPRLDHPGGGVRDRRGEGSDPTNDVDAADPEREAAPTRRTDDPLIALPQLRRALEATTNGVSIVDMTRPDHPLVYVNSAFERLSGRRADQVLGTNCRFMQGPATDRAAVRRISEAVAQGRQYEETILNYRAGSDEPWWNEIHFAPIRDDSGRVCQYIGIQNDVTAKVEAELALQAERLRADAYSAELEKLAFTDSMTGLLNRRRAFAVLEEMLERAQDSHGSVALLYLDVDDFKQVNDQHGHTAGDTVLALVGDELSSIVGATAARIGGDEFLLVLDDLESSSAIARATHLADQLDIDLRNALRRFDVSVSIGISTSPHDGDRCDALLHAADRRMYQHKADSKFKQAVDKLG